MKATRPETGAMEFEGDWSGIFIRGDNALWYAETLKQFCGDTGLINATVFSSLIELLSSANQHVVNPDKQLMKKFEDCIKEE